MHLEWLETFVATVEKGTLSAAAQHLHLTQPAVTRHLQALEDYYGARLLERRGREVRLTAAGRRLYRSAKEVLRRLERVKREIAELEQLLQGELLLGASTTPGQYLLPELIAAFREEHPGLQVSLRIADTLEVLRGVQEGELDLGVVGARRAERGLRFLSLAEDEIVLIVPAGHRLAGREEVLPRELEGELFVWREPGSGTRQIVEERMTAKGVRLAANPVMTLGSTEAVVNAVEAGLGLSFVTFRAAEKSVRLGRLWALRVKGIDLKRELFLVGRTRETSPAVSAFWSFAERYRLLNPPGRVLLFSKAFSDGPSPLAGIEQDPPRQRLPSDGKSDR
ncbi:MAG: LysR substrate-binding domain-containing protein [Moorellales bacterium]